MSMFDWIPSAGPIVREMGSWAIDRLTSAAADVAVNTTSTVADVVVNTTSTVVEQGMSQLPPVAFEYGMSTMADAPAQVVTEAAAEVVTNLTNAVVANLADAPIALANASNVAATQTWGEFVSDWAYYLVGGGVLAVGGTGAAVVTTRGQKPAVEVPAKGMTAEQCGQAVDTMFYKTAAEEVKKSEGFKNLLKNQKTLATMQNKDLKVLGMQWLSENTRHIQTAIDAMPAEAKTQVAGFSDNALTKMTNGLLRNDPKDQTKKLYETLPANPERLKGFLGQVEAAAKPAVAKP